MPKKHLIYGLCDPRTDEIRYVGRSSSGFTRPRDPHSAHCGNWIQSLHKLGLIPWICILEELGPTDDVDDRLNEAERCWIKILRERGVNLTNLTDGGERGRKFAPEVIQKMRETRGGERNPFHGKKHTPESKLKMRTPVRCVDDGRVFPGLNIAASHYGVKPSALSLVCNGKRRKTGGFRFEFVENP